MVYGNIDCGVLVRLRRKKMVDHYDENRENWDDNYKKDECPGDENDCHECGWTIHTCKCEEEKINGT